MREYLFLFPPQAMPACPRGPPAPASTPWRYNENLGPCECLSVCECPKGRERRGGESQWEVETPGSTSQPLKGACVKAKMSPPLPVGQTAECQRRACEGRTSAGSPGAPKSRRLSSRTAASRVSLCTSPGKLHSRCHLRADGRVLRALLR